MIVQYDNGTTLCAVCAVCCVLCGSPSSSRNDQQRSLRRSRRLNAIGCNLVTPLYTSLYRHSQGIFCKLGAVWVWVWVWVCHCHCHSLDSRPLRPHRFQVASHPHVSSRTSHSHHHAHSTEVDHATGSTSAQALHLLSCAYHPHAAVCVKLPTSRM